jgi:uncharacterized protein YndB with AHSA1/START domain
LSQPEVRQRIWIDASPERVWKAITDLQQLEQWYAPGCRWDFPSAQVGETVNFYNTDTDILKAVIETVDAPTLLRLDWGPDAEYPAFSQVTDYRLEPENGGTRITMSEVGYDVLLDDVRQERIDTGNTAYEGSLATLKALFEGS